MIKLDINTIPLLTLETSSITQPANIYYILLKKSTYMISYSL